MIPWRMALMAGVLLALPVHAHEVSGQHGGRVTDAGKYHVELVAKGETVDVFVSDGSQKPVPATGFSQKVGMPAATARRSRSAWVEVELAMTTPSTPDSRGAPVCAGPR